MIYNIYSIVYAMNLYVFSNYRPATGSYESITDYTTLKLTSIFDDIIFMISGGSVEVNIYDSETKKHQCKI